MQKPREIDAQGVTVLMIIYGPMIIYGDRTTRRYDDAGNLLRLVDPAGNRTDSAYDAFDRLASETTYDGAAPQARKPIYDNNGNVAISTDRNGRALRRYYDRLDRVSEERWYPSETAARAQDGSYSAVVNFVYDAFGRLEERRIAHRVPAVVDRVTDSYEYDGLDRVVEHCRRGQALRWPDARPPCELTSAYPPSEALLRNVAHRFP